MEISKEEEDVDFEHQLDYCPESFKDMVACDGCDHWFHMSCANLMSASQGDWLCKGCQ